MQIIWRVFGQRPDLAAWEARPLSRGVEAGVRDGDRLVHELRVLGAEPPGKPVAGGLFRRIAAAIAEYRIFPTRLMTGVLKRPVQVGDTFANCFHALPGVDLLFGGRVQEVFDEATEAGWRAGFRFWTVRGHPMVGEEMFWVEKDRTTGEIRAGLASWSRPGMWLTRLGLPFLRWHQTRATRLALRNLAAIANGDALR